MQRRDRDLARIARHRLTAIAATHAAGASSDPRPTGAPPSAGHDPDSGAVSTRPLSGPSWLGLDPATHPAMNAARGTETTLSPLEPDAGTGPAAADLRVDVPSIPPEAPHTGSGWTPRPAPGRRYDAAPRPVDVATDRPAVEPRSDPTSSGSDAPARAAQPRSAAALQVAAAGYAATHGDPTTRAPVPRRRMRWAISWQLAAAAGAVVLLVAGAVALRATAGAPGPAVVLPTPAPSGPVAALASPTAAAGVVVDVVGAVAAPGVVRLAQGSRVVDAIAAAGGTTADAQVSALNLARVVVDGEQIAVPRPGEQPAAAGSSAPVGGNDLVDLNTADAAALDALPGIGPVLAERIVSHREDGPFTTVDELADVAGIGPTLLERLRDLVRV